MCVVEPGLGLRLELALPPGAQGERTASAGSTRTPLSGTSGTKRNLICSPGRAISSEKAPIRSGRAVRMFRSGSR